MSSRPVNDPSQDGDFGDATTATTAPLANKTGSTSEEEHPTAVTPEPEKRVWSKEEIAELAVHLEGDTDRLKAPAPADPVLRRLLTNLGRRAKPPAEPIPERANSEGGDYVAYSAVASPAHAQSISEPKAGVIVQGFDATTEVLPGRSRRGSGRLRSLLQALVLLALGAAGGVLVSRSALPARTASPPADERHGARACPTALASAPPSPADLGRAPRVEVAPPTASAGTARDGEGTTAPIVHKGAPRTATPASPPKRVPDVQARRTGRTEGDDVMEAVEY